MDADGHIYRAPEDQIPAEDKARLDGFLKGRAEAGELARMREQFAALKEEALRREEDRANASAEDDQHAG
jgi:hypothetical protein